MKKMADGAQEKDARTSCAFFMKRKNRFCKMIVEKGEKYSGEHSHLGGEDKVFLNMTFFDQLYSPGICCAPDVALNDRMS